MLLRNAALALTLVGASLTAFVACEGSSSEELAAKAGGTPAPDGARGFCCPARTGGCALSGGYREEGTCPTSFDICDNMCEQRIVKDEHGCDALTYKLPSRTTTYAGTQSCDSSVFNEDPTRRDAGESDAGSDASEGDAGDDDAGDGDIDPPT